MRKDIRSKIVENLSKKIKVFVKYLIINIVNKIVNHGSLMIEQTTILMVDLMIEIVIVEIVIDQINKINNNNKAKAKTDMVD